MRQNDFLIGNSKLTEGVFESSTRQNLRIPVEPDVAQMLHKYDIRKRVL
jgi:hypothetical protein